MACAFARPSALRHLSLNRASVGECHCDIHQRLERLAAYLLHLAARFAATLLQRWLTTLLDVHHSPVHPLIESLASQGLFPCFPGRSHGLASVRTFAGNGGVSSYYRSMATNSSKASRHL